MPKLTHSHPRYRLHRPSGQAVVTLDGKDFYLGPHGSKSSRAEYDRLIGEWYAAGRKLPTAVPGRLTVVEMLALYWEHAEQHYRKDGQPTGELKNIRYAARPLNRLYGETLVKDFGPLALKSIQQRMIEDGLCRSVINSRIGKIKRIFRWAVSEQIAPADCLHALETVMGLQRGRTKASESDPVLPVDDATVDATLPHLPPVVVDMVRLQRLTGCRPGEVCGMRPCDVNTKPSIWRYVPASHKSQHHGKQRVVFIGPQAQGVLRPYLNRESQAYCFSPAESRRLRYEMLRASRKSKVQPSQVDRSKKRPQAQPGDRYKKDSYNRAIRRACEIADKKAHEDHPEIAADQAIVPTWHPNRLRHSLASKVRADHGLEAAQVVLGHSNADVTQIYAERNFSLAESVIGKIG